MKINYYLFFAAVLLMQYGCGHKKASDPLADSGRTQRTENLLASLDSITGKGFLIGQQDATLYGIGWEGDSARSDIKTITGEEPAIAGFEIGGIEQLQVNDSGHVVPADAKNIYGSLFSTVRQRILDQYDRSGVCVLTWHVKARPSESQIDHLCDFLNSLEEPYGVRVPVILYPCSPQQDKAFWELLTERIDEKEVTNALLACDMKVIKADIAEKIDIIGLSDCCQADVEDAIYKARLSKELTQLSSLGKQYGKPVGVFAAGQQGLKTEKWFTSVLMPAIASNKLSFLMFARNDNNTPGNFYVPFPGQQNVADFAAFVNASATLFLDNVNGLYLNKE